LLDSKERKFWNACSDSFIFKYLPLNRSAIELQGEINGPVIPYGPRQQRGSVEQKTRQVAAAPRATATEMAGYMSRNAAKSGEAITGAGDLAARYVIHAVGPVWSGGGRGEAELLAGAYRCCLELAVEHDCQSIALPALSTGAYRYPIDQAARVGLATAIEFLREHGRPSLVRFVLFDAGAYAAFAAALEELVQQSMGETS